MVKHLLQHREDGFSSRKCAEEDLMELMAEGEDAGVRWGTKSWKRAAGVWGWQHSPATPSPGNTLCQVPLQQTPAHAAAGFRMPVVGDVGAASPGERGVGCSAGAAFLLGIALNALKHLFPRAPLSAMGQCLWCCSEMCPPDGEQASAGPSSWSWVHMAGELNHREHLWVNPQHHGALSR